MQLNQTTLTQLRCMPAAKRLNNRHMEVLRKRNMLPGVRSHLARGLAGVGLVPLVWVAADANVALAVRLADDDIYAMKALAAASALARTLGGPAGCSGGTGGSVVGAGGGSCALKGPNGACSLQISQVLDGVQLEAGVQQQVCLVGL